MFKNIKKFFIKTKKELSTLEYIDSGSLFYSKIAIYTGEGSITTFENMAPCP